MSELLYAVGGVVALLIIFRGKTDTYNGRKPLDPAYSDRWKHTGVPKRLAGIASSTLSTSQKEAAFSNIMTAKRSGAYAYGS